MDAVVDNIDVFARGLWGTVTLTLWAGAGSLVLGSLLAVLRVSPSGALRGFAGAYVNVVRNTPLTLVFFFTALGLPILGLSLDVGSDLEYRIFALMALIAYTSCFVCETLRAGIATVGVGQAEASRSIGMTFAQTLRHVVVPQALRTVVAPLGSVMIAMAKNTSIASAFNNTEIISAMRTTIENRGDAVIALLVATAVAYLLVTLTLSAGFALLEKKVAIVR